MNPTLIKNILIQCQFVRSNYILMIQVKFQILILNSKLKKKPCFNKGRIGKYDAIILFEEKRNSVLINFLFHSKFHSNDMIYEEDV